MATYSPAPWVIRQRTTALGIIASDGYAVAAVRAKYPRKPEHRATRDANANLIAAAPDLLEALKGAMESAVWRHTSECICEVCLHCRAVIASAEGH